MPHHRRRSGPRLPLGFQKYGQTAHRLPILGGMASWRGFARWCAGVGIVLALAATATLSAETTSLTVAASRRGRHVDQPEQPAGRSPLGRLQGQGRHVVDAVRRVDGRGAHPARQDLQAPQGAVVRRMDLQRHHLQEGRRVHRELHRRRPGRARADDHLPDAAVGARHVQAAADHRRAGQLQAVDAPGRGRHRQRPRRPDPAARRPVRPVRARTSSNDLLAGWSPTPPRGTPRCRTRASTSTPAPPTGPARTRRRPPTSWCPAGIQYARGFAVNSTHYATTANEITAGTALVHELNKRGLRGKHFVINTSSNGQGVHVQQGPGRQPRQRGRVRDPLGPRCVTLGIPPTTNVASTKWGFAAQTRRAGRQVRRRLPVVRPPVAEQAGLPLREVPRPPARPDDAVLSRARPAACCAACGKLSQ